MTAAAALLELLDGLDNLDVDPDARSAFRQLIVSIGITNGCAAVERDTRVRFVRHLLALRVSRITIRDRLMAHFDVSRPHAYRIISAALQVSQKPVISETRIGSNRNNPP